MTSREALEVPDVPGTLLIVVVATLAWSWYRVCHTREQGGGGGSFGGDLTGADADLIRPVQKYAEKAFQEVRVRTKVLSMATAGKQIKVVMETDGRKPKNCMTAFSYLSAASRIMSISGSKTRKSRRTTGGSSGQRETTDERPRHLRHWRCGGRWLLAHKATREGKVAVDAITGEFETLDKYIVPAVVFTNPEIAWCGLTESEAKQRGTTVKVVRSLGLRPAAR